MKTITKNQFEDIQFSLTSTVVEKVVEKELLHETTLNVNGVDSAVRRITSSGTEYFLL